MAITLLELNARLSRVVKDLEGGVIAKAMVLAAEDADQLFKLRVQQKGENAQGQKFKPYSTKPMLAGRKTFKTEKAFLKVAGSKKKRKNLEWVTLGGNKYEQYLTESSGQESKLTRLFILPGGYKQLRELHGLQTAHVDFTWSGAMMSNIKLISKDSEHRQGVARIGASKESERKKIEGNQKRKGQIMELSKDEEVKVSRTYASEIIKAFIRAGLPPNNYL